MSQPQVEADEIIEENLTGYIMSDMDEKKTLGALQDADAPASLSSGLGLDEAYEEAQQLSDVSEYIQAYSTHKDNIQSKEFGGDDDGGILIPEDFQALEPTSEEAEKLDYVIQAMVGEILSTY